MGEAAGHPLLDQLVRNEPSGHCGAKGSCAHHLALQLPHLFAPRSPREYLHAGFAHRLTAEGDPAAVHGDLRILY